MARTALNLMVCITFLAKMTQEIRDFVPDQELKEKIDELQKRNKELVAHQNEHVEMFDFLDAKMGLDSRFAGFRETWREEFARERERNKAPTSDEVEKTMACEECRRHEGDDE